MMIYDRTNNLRLRADILLWLNLNLRPRLLRPQNFVNACILDMMEDDFLHHDLRRRRGLVDLHDVHDVHLDHVLILVHIPHYARLETFCCIWVWMLLVQKLRLDLRCLRQFDYEAVFVNNYLEIECWACLEYKLIYFIFLIIKKKIFFC